VRLLFENGVYLRAASNQRNTVQLFFTPTTVFLKLSVNFFSFVNSAFSGEGSRRTTNRDLC